MNTNFSNLSNRFLTDHENDKTNEIFENLLQMTIIAKIALLNKGFVLLK